MVEGVEYFYVVYSGIWLGLFMYLLYLHSRNRSLQGRLEDLKEMVHPNGSEREEKKR